MRYLHAPLRELAPGPAVDGARALAGWAAAVRDASECCVLLDQDGTVTAASAPFAELVRVPLAELTGAALFDSVLRVLDFDVGLPVPPDELSRVPPLVALSAGALGRSLIRVRRRDGSCVTFDAVSSPLHGPDPAGVRGSVTFLHLV